MNLLRRHAVAGTLAWHGLLMDPADATQRQAWAELRLRGFVAEQRGGKLPGQRQSRFRQEVLRDVLLRNVKPAWRTAEHLRVARWLETQATEAAGGLDELTLYHYTLAGDASGEARFALRAGDRALRALAPAEALRLFGLAHARCLAASTEPQILELLRRAYLACARTCAFASKPKEVAKWLAAAESDQRACSEPGGRAFRARLYGARGELDEALGRSDDALTALSAAAELLGSCVTEDEQLARLEVAARRAMILARRGRGEEARRVAAAALESSRGNGPSPDAGTWSAWHRAIGTLYAALGHVASAETGGLERAQEAHEKARHHWASAGYPAGEGVALLHLGNVAWHRGDAERARTLWGEAAAASAASGRPRGVALAETNLGELALDAGDTDAALRHLRRAEKTLTALEAVDVLPETMRLVAAVLLAAGDVEGAERQATAAVALALDHHHNRYAASALATLADVLDARGQGDAARDRFVEARDILQSMGRVEAAEHIQRRLDARL